MEVPHNRPFPRAVPFFPSSLFFQLWVQEPNGNPDFSFSAAWLEAFLLELVFLYPSGSFFWFSPMLDVFS